MNFKRQLIAALAAIFFSAVPVTSVSAFEAVLTNERSGNVIHVDQNGSTTQVIPICKRPRGMVRGPAKTQVTNTVQVDLTDLTTVYIGLNVTDSAYVKVGYATMDVETNENLGTGSSYGNTSLDGTVYGVGYQKDLDAMFVRVEGTYMDFDGVSLSANDNTITLKNLDGLTGKISIGKSF